MPATRALKDDRVPSKMRGKLLGRLQALLNLRMIMARANGGRSSGNGKRKDRISCFYQKTPSARSKLTSSFLHECVQRTMPEDEKDIYIIIGTVDENHVDKVEVIRCSTYSGPTL